jgi:hypothetical protein
LSVTIGSEESGKSLSDQERRNQIDFELTPIFG